MAITQFMLSANAMPTDFINLKLPADINSSAHEIFNDERARNRKEQTSDLSGTWYGITHTRSLILLS